MKWNIRFLRVAMWVFRLLALVAVAFGIASFFVFIDIGHTLATIYFSITPNNIPKAPPNMWLYILLLRILPAFILALIFFTLAALISLNLRFYAALRQHR